MILRARLDPQRMLAATLLAATIGACSGAAPSPIPSVPGATPASGTPGLASPAGSPSAPGASAAASPEPPFDASHVAVTLEPYAHVDGGPLAFAAPHDGSSRLFVASQDGRVWVVTNGVDPTIALDIGDRITSGGERGLLGIALHPGFPTDPHVYLDYTDRNGNTVVSSFVLATGEASRLDGASERILFTTVQPFANHNGGALAFGPDADLYISLGDGGSGGDPQGNGQNRDVTLGKILRIDVDHASTDHPYSIPAGNPFGADPNARPEIWLYGLRNPWRLSFDRQTGTLWIGDVGQNKWEEVDAIPAGIGGLDLGWNRLEATHCYLPGNGCSPSGMTPPVAEYGHDQGCTIIGGYVYRGAAFPALRGGYLFADYCSGTIWAIPATATSLTKPIKVGATGSGTSAFGEDEAGELYVANLDGTISRVTASTR